MKAGGSKRKEQSFTAERALEKFRLLSAVGKEGQEPKASYQKGSTIILSDLPPGTILRETYYPDPDRNPIAIVQEEIDGKLVNKDIDYGPPGPLYFWYCLGSFNDKNKELMIFPSSVFIDGNNTTETYIFYEKGSWQNRTSFREEKIISSQQGKIEFIIGEIGRIWDQTEGVKAFRRKLGFTPKNTTQKIDVIAFGKKVKKEIRKKEKVGLKQLVPQRIPSAI